MWDFTERLMQQELADIHLCAGHELFASTQSQSIFRALYLQVAVRFYKGPRCVRIVTLVGRVAGVERLQGAG